MSEKDCLKEKDIAKLSEAVFGKNGLNENMAVVRTQLDTIQGSVGAIEANTNDLLKAIHALQIFKAEIEKEKQTEHKVSDTSWQRAGIIISAIIGASAVIASIIWAI